MDLPVMRMFFQTAPLVYSSVARLAAENGTNQQIDLLKATQASFAASARAGETANAALLNHQLHDQIGLMAQNPYLLVSLRRMLIDHTRLSRTFFRQQSEADSLRIAKSIDQHDAMIAAIEAREPALAIDLTLQHWDLTRDQFEKYIRPDPLPIDVTSTKDRRKAV